MIAYLTDDAKAGKDKVNVLVEAATVRLAVDAYRHLLRTELPAQRGWHLPIYEIMGVMFYVSKNYTLGKDTFEFFMQCVKKFIIFEIGL